MAVLVHVDGHKVVADFGRVLCRICEAELVVLGSLRQLGLLFEQHFVALNALLPADFVEALSEENYVGQDSLVEHLVSLARCSVQEEGENFVDQHIQLVVVAQFIVIALPIFSVWIFTFVRFAGSILVFFGFDVSFFVGFCGFGITSLHRELHQLLIERVLFN